MLHKRIWLCSCFFTLADKLLVFIWQERASVRSPLWISCLCYIVCVCVCVCVCVHIYIIVKVKWAYSLFLSNVFFFILTPPWVYWAFKKKLNRQNRWIGGRRKDGNKNILGKNKSLYECHLPGAQSETWLIGCVCAVCFGSEHSKLWFLPSFLPCQTTRVGVVVGWSVRAGVCLCRLV